MRFWKKETAISGKKIKTHFETENPNIKIEITAPFGEMVQQVINMAGEASMST